MCKTWPDRRLKMLYSAFSAYGKIRNVFLTKKNTSVMKSTSCYCEAKLPISDGLYSASFMIDVLVYFCLLLHMCCSVAVTQSSPHRRHWLQPPLAGSWELSTAAAIFYLLQGRAVSQSWKPSLEAFENNSHRQPSDGVWNIWRSADAASNALRPIFPQSFMRQIWTKPQEIKCTFEDISTALHVSLIYLYPSIY